MSRLFEELGIGRLSVDERLALVQEIWDRIAETERRLELHAADPESGSTWEEVMAWFRQRRD